MNLKSYKKIRFLLLLALFIFVIGIEFIMVLCFDMTNFNVVFIALLILFAILYFLIDLVTNNIYTKKNNNELIKWIFKTNKKSKKEYYAFYKQISEYISSEDLGKIFMVQEIKCRMETENYHIPMISVTFAVFAFMVNNIDKMYSGLLFALMSLFSITDDLKSTDIFAQVSIPILIIYIAIEVTKILRKYRFNKFILSLIAQIEEDIKIFDTCGISKNEKMIKYINDNSVSLLN